MIQEQELIDRLSGLAPMLAAHADEAERLRRPVDSVMVAIEETQAYRWFVPRRFGGFEFSLEGFMEVGMALGAGCLSTAWVTTFCMEHNWLLGLFDRPAQEDIFGRQPYIIAPGALAPKGRAEPVEGGYRVSGRWEWGTGVMHADWVMVGALGPGANPEQPDLYMYLIPRDEVRVVDTWHVAGMVGTGSNDIEAEAVFVPAHRRANVSAMRAGDSPGARFHDTSTYRMPMLPVLGLTAAAPAVGCARKAVTLFRERLTERLVYGTSGKQGERAVAQVRLANLDVAIQRTEQELLRLAREVAAWGQRGEPCDEIARAELKLRIAHVVRQSRDVVRDVVEASGAHAHFLSNPLQRFLRDLHTLSCHTVFDVDLGAENYGRLLLGLPPNSMV
jgi:3-hydroxy-9,10-secoandrosta-1,3,5(10)-triene-9,17-dione monooxygenase